MRHLHPLPRPRRAGRGAGRADRALRHPISRRVDELTLHNPVEMSDEKSKTSLERIGIAGAILASGVSLLASGVSLYWGWEDRSANENVTAALVSEPQPDSATSLEIVLWNTGRKTVHLRSAAAVAVHQPPDVPGTYGPRTPKPEYAYSATFPDVLLREIPPEKVVRIQSNPMSRDQMQRFRIRGVILLETLNGTHVLEVKRDSESPLRILRMGNEGGS